MGTPEGEPPPEGRSTRFRRRASSRREFRGEALSLDSVAGDLALVPQVIAGETHKPPAAIGLACQNSRALFATRRTCRLIKRTAWKVRHAAAATRGSTTVDQLTVLDWILQHR